MPSASFDWADEVIENMECSNLQQIITTGDDHATLKNMAAQEPESTVKDTQTRNHKKSLVPQELSISEWSSAARIDDPVPEFELRLSVDEATQVLERERQNLKELEDSNPSPSPDIEDLSAGTSFKIEKYKYYSAKVRERTLSFETRNKPKHVISCSPNGPPVIRCAISTIPEESVWELLPEDAVSISSSEESAPDKAVAVLEDSTDTPINLVLKYKRATKHRQSTKNTLLSNHDSASTEGTSGSMPATTWTELSMVLPKEVTAI